MTTPMPNYPKVTQLEAKDRAKSDHAETAKEKHARYATLTIVDENDMMVSKNLVSLENIEVKEGDQMRSLKINVVCFRVLSQDVMSSKSKKRRVAENNGIGNVIHQKKFI